MDIWKIFRLYRKYTWKFFHILTLFGENKMAIIEQKNIYYIKSQSPNTDINKLINLFHLRLCDKFANCSATEIALAFENGVIGQFLRFGFDFFISVISSGEIIAEQRNNYIKIESKVSFKRFVILNIMISVLTLFSFIIESKSEMLILFLLLIAYTYISIQIAAVRFDNLMTNCIKDSEFKT